MPVRTLEELISHLAERHGAGANHGSVLEELDEICHDNGLSLRYDQYNVDAEPAEAADDAEPAAAAVGAEPAAVGGGAAEGAPLPEGLEPFDAGEIDAAPVVVDAEGHVRKHYADPALCENEPQPGGFFGAISVGTAVAGRVIVSTGRARVQADTPLRVECNGVVFDAKTWKPLVVPSRAFAARPSGRAINPGLAAGDYSIIQVSDGTMVNLYRWDHPAHGPIWCISTRYGYDVSHLRWMGRQTYAEILFELLGRYPAFVAETGMELARDFLCKGDTRLTFKNLDPGRCYTVGFRCHRYHPLLLDPEAVWNVQSAGLAAPYAVDHAAGGLPGVPRQRVFAPAEINALIGRKADAAVRFGDLVKLGEDSLDAAISAIAAGETPGGGGAAATGGGGAAATDGAAAAAAAAATHTTPFAYGFILRSHKTHVDVLCDSKLLVAVRRLVYQRPKQFVRDNLNERNRLEYYALRAFLTPVGDRDLFLGLFPQFRERFRDYQNFVTEVVTLINHMHRQKALEPAAAAAEAAEPRTATRTVARALLAALLSSPSHDFAAFGGDATSIVHDRACVPDHALIFLKSIGATAS